MPVPAFRLPDIHSLSTAWHQSIVSIVGRDTGVGAAAIEKAAKDAGAAVTVPFTPGRVDASQGETDASSLAPLEPTADGFRNYLRGQQRLAAEELLLDRAQLLTLTAPDAPGVYEGRDRNNQRAQVDGDARRPRLRLAFPAPCPGRGLCVG